MGCSGPRDSIETTREEAYVLYKQMSLGLHRVSSKNAISVVKKYSKNGSLTVVTFARALNELGLLKLGDNKVDKEKLKLNKNWVKFYSCLSDYRDETGETFNTLNVIMSFVLLTKSNKEEKIAALYENLDWQCKGYINRKMIRLFIKNFCVVAAQILPYFAEDVLDSKMNLKHLRDLWIWVTDKMPEELTTKIMRERLGISKEDFASTFSEDRFRFLFNAVLLRRHMTKDYEKQFEDQKKATPRKTRLSIYSPEEKDDKVAIEDEINDGEANKDSNNEPEVIIVTPTKH